MNDTAESIIKKYCKDVLANKIPACSYVKKAVKRFENDIKRDDPSFDYVMDWAYAERFYKFTKHLRLPDRESVLNLMPWQLFCLTNLLGWKYKNNPNKRRFRSGAIFCPRKNGKTTGIMYPMLLWDFLTSQSAESYFFEKDDKQSEKMFIDLSTMIKKSFKNNEIEINHSTITRQNSRIAYFSSESGGIDGYKPSLAIIDEYFAYMTDKAVTAMRYGSRGRESGLVLIITTAGIDISTPCYDEYLKVEKILNGILTDDSYFGMIFTIDQKDDWKESRAYIKANPSIDTIIDRKILEQDLQDALGQPAHQPDYRAKTLNQWISGASSWIPLNKWQEQNEGIIKWEDFSSLSCYGALDLSSVGDFTAFTLCFNNNGKYYFRHRFYIPENTLNERYKKENIGIIGWVEQKHLTLIPGSTIDYTYIFEDIKKDYNSFQIKEIAYDNWGSRELINAVENDMGNIILIPYNQSLKQMSQPTKTYEKLILENKIVDTNPIMVWMVSNAVIKPDVNMNYKPLKDYRQSNKRIDGVITSIMALDRTIANKDEVTRTDFNDILGLFK